MKWKDKTVLITGAGGFLGYWLTTKMLTKGASVVGIDQKYEEPNRVNDPEFKSVCGDITDRPLIDKVLHEHPVDAVVHLAARSLVGNAHETPSKTFEVNTRGTWILLDVLRQLEDVPDAIAIASSDKAYGRSTTLPYTEEDRLQATTPYAASKAAAERVANTYADTYDMPLAITRCTNIYGPRDMNTSRLIPNVTQDVLNGRSPQLRSDGTSVRDWIYISDVVHGYLQLVELLYDKRIESGDVFNFGTGDGTQVIDIVDEILRLASRQDLNPVIKEDDAGELSEQYADPSKAAEELNWEPEIDLTEGLKNTIDWYSRFLSTGGQNGDGSI